MEEVDRCDYPSTLFAFHSCCFKEGLVQEQKCSESNVRFRQKIWRSLHPESNRDNTGSAIAACLYRLKRHHSYVQ